MSVSFTCTEKRFCRHLRTSSSLRKPFGHLTGRLDKHDLNARIGELGRKIEEVKGEVHETLLKKYADFFPNLGMAFDLQKRVQDITEEMATTKNIMENEVSFVKKSDKKCLYHKSVGLPIPLLNCLAKHPTTLALPITKSKPGQE